MTTKTRPTFEQWMKLVDQAVAAKIGISVHDLPDCPFRDWYDTHKTPKNAASAAIRNAKE